MGTGVFSPGVKRPECEAGLSHPYVAGVKDSGTSPPFVIYGVCLINELKQRKIFIKKTSNLNP
jgi:hypothetical protein